MSQQRVCTGLVDFDDLSLKESALKVKRLAEQSYFSYVVTPNVDHLSRLCASPTSQILKPIYDNAALTLCDSRVLSKLLVVIKKPINNVVPGSDLTQFLFDHALKGTDTILIVGGNHEEINALKNRYPLFSIQHINPSMGFIDKPNEVAVLVDDIKNIAADYIFLAVGSPRQEVLAYRLYQSEIAKGVALCIGASINFIVGVESRAPMWMQRLHMEWFYRMLQDPKRLLRRYGGNALSIPRVLYALRKERV